MSERNRERGEMGRERNGEKKRREDDQSVRQTEKRKKIGSERDGEKERREDDQSENNRKTEDERER